MVLQFEALGFSRAGTYLYKPKPFAIYCATMLSHNGKTIADISDLDGEAAHSFTSVLADGQVLETACCLWAGSMEQINDSRRVHADMVKRGGECDHPDMLYLRHCRTLTELGGRYVREIAEVTPN